MRAKGLSMEMFLRGAQRGPAQRGHAQGLLYAQGPAQTSTPEGAQQAEDLYVGTEPPDDGYLYEVVDYRADEIKVWSRLGRLDSAVPTCTFREEPDSSIFLLPDGSLPGIGPGSLSWEEMIRRLDGDVHAFEEMMRRIRPLTKFCFFHNYCR